MTELIDSPESERSQRAMRALLRMEKLDLEEELMATVRDSECKAYSETLEGDGLLPATRAELCRRLRRIPEAIAAYERALSLAQQEPERRFLRRRKSELERGTMPPETLASPTGPGRRHVPERSSTPRRQ